MLTSFFDQVDVHLQKARKENAIVALILNSGVWDVLRDEAEQESQDFPDHIQAMEMLLHSLFHSCDLNGVSVFWKSMTALHIHQINKETCIKSNHCLSRTRYMSSSRAMKLNKLHHLVLQRYPQVGILELFDITYQMEHLVIPGDGRHYVRNATIQMWDSVVE